MTCAPSGTATSTTRPSPRAASWTRAAGRTRPLATTVWTTSRRTAATGSTRVGRVQTTTPTPTPTTANPSASSHGQR